MVQICILFFGAAIFLFLTGSAIGRNIRTHKSQERVDGIGGDIDVRFSRVPFQNL